MYKQINKNGQTIKKMTSKYLNRQTKRKCCVGVVPQAWSQLGVLR